MIEMNMFGFNQNPSLYKVYENIFLYIIMKSLWILKTQRKVRKISITLIAFRYLLEKKFLQHFFLKKKVINPLHGTILLVEEGIKQIQRLIIDSFLTGTLLSDALIEISYPNDINYLKRSYHSHPVLNLFDPRLLFNSEH